MTDEEFYFALLRASARSAAPTADWLVAEGIAGWEKLYGSDGAATRVRMLADAMEQKLVEARRPPKPALRLVD
ncbi:MAG: hypothetical protein GEU87_08220 [Alphaproteobacteria bacterium]|nr:hypothetical protein [Alphaproteobacteria bacterium]